ncbi:protein bric-a-brac 1 isoform X3 [Nilaparvata lugens]|uniref:protein bric-a-brac 1 isoform X3 n=1 Tax=Nilaparvata lugens TaxID=108931 RepID=UPI00193E3657|nr:protein bric-a-brac 1 isoform X3 [Nilaparvata lugens]
MHAFASSGGGGSSSASSSTAGGGGSGSPQLFCLRWNNYQSNLTNVFDQLLQSESFVDVTLACDGHSVKAHKVVLSACSPYFQALFFDNPCRHPIVILKDVRWPELKAAVEFMYKGEINVSQEQIGPLLQVAESLKIRGLADVSGNGDSTDDSKLADTVSLAPRPSKKRRRDSSPSADSPSASNGLPDALGLVTTSPTPASGPGAMCPPPPPPPQQQQQASAASSQGQMSLAALPPPPPPPQSAATAAADDMEIKPGIAEMIREEERAKMLESTHASWLGASTSSLADSYQYQLQSMWQKCWNTNQSLVHHLRFRERGPLKSWRPETMAEAILSVLKEGLSLSQAARKYDIPYPTFVLYANRVHNMLGPSADGGTADLRPKGRGRPQRILLGIWPEDHIHGVIRAVVFRDPQHIKEEAINLGYHRMQEPLYGSPGCNNESSGGGAVSPSSAAAAAVVAVAQNLRQQMLAAAHHGTAADAAHFNFLAAHCSNGGTAAPPGTMHSPLPSPVNSSPRSSPLSAANPNAANSLEQQHLGPAQSPLAAGGHLLSGGNSMFSLSSYKAAAAAAAAAATANQQSSLPVFRPEQLFHDEIEDLVKRPQSSETPKLKSPPQAPSTPVSQMQSMHAGAVPNYKPPTSVGGGVTLVRPEYLFQDEIEDLVKRPSSANSEASSKVKVGIGMTYKPTNESYSSNARADALFQEEIDELVKSPASSTPNDQSAAIPLKVEQRID